MTDVTVNSAPRTIVLKGRGIHEERPVNGASLPGSLMTLNSSDQFVKHASAGAKAGAWFLCEDELHGNGIDDVIADGDLGQVEFCHPGMQVNAYVAAAAAAIVIGDPLESDGAGGLRLSASAAGVAASRSYGAVNTQATFTARTVGDAGNNIDITVSAAGSPSVTVTGLNIVIVPDTGGNTITALIAQVAADAAANNLVVVTTTGNGSGAAGTLATGNLAGGVDANASPTSAVIAKAVKAVDNSGGGSVARLPVVII
jgi:hypothetical protein